MTLVTNEQENPGNPGVRLANTQVGMATCPPLLVDDGVGQMRPPGPRRAVRPRRVGTVEAPEVRQDDRGRDRPSRTRHQTAPAPHRGRLLITL